MGWPQFSVLALVVAALLFAPGYVVIRCLRLGRVTALCAAPAVSVLTIAGAAILAPRLGLRWGPLPVLVLTAVLALAAALRADVCEIYTDVDGVFSADPRIVPAARQLPYMTHEETLELAAHGAKVLHLRAVEFARKFNVPVHVRSSFSNKEGTWIVDEKTMKDKALEAPVVAGVAHDRSQGKVTITRVPNVPGMASKIFAIVAGIDGNIDMIVQNTAVAAPDVSNLSFTLPKAEVAAVVEALKSHRGELGFGECPRTSASCPWWAPECGPTRAFRPSFSPRWETWASTPT